MNNNEEFPNRKIYTIAGIIAACLVILAILLITNPSNKIKKSNTYSTDNSINSNKSIANTEEKQQYNDNTNQKEETAMNPIITLKVTKHHTTDIGLVYEGVIIDTTSTSIKKNDTVYVSLRKLTRHDLLHTYEPNEEFTISLYDDTFTPSPSTPYYALKKIK